MSANGRNLRLNVTSLTGDSRHLYNRLHCAHGEMESHIKQQQLGLPADHTSAHHWWPNYLRLLFSTLSYVLMEAIRRIGLEGTELAHALAATIRLKLLKIGAVSLLNTHRIRFLLSSACPYQDLFFTVATQFGPGWPSGSAPRHADKQRVVRGRCAWNSVETAISALSNGSSPNCSHSASQNPALVATRATSWLIPSSIP